MASTPLLIMTSQHALQQLPSTAALYSTLLHPTESDFALPQAEDTAWAHEPHKRKPGCGQHWVRLTALAILRDVSSSGSEWEEWTLRSQNRESHLPECPNWCWMAREQGVSFLSSGLLPFQNCFFFSLIFSLPPPF